MTARFGLLLVIVAVVTAGCRNVSKEERDAELKQATAFVQAADAISKQCRSATPDWTVVEAAYPAVMPLAKTVDEAHGTTVESDLQQSVKACINGEQVHLNSQVIDASLHYLAVMLISDSLDRLYDYRQRAHIGTLVETYMAVVRPTLKQIDQNTLSGVQALESNATEIVTYLDALQGSEVDMVVEELRSLFYRAYALGIIYELEQVEASPDAPEAAGRLARAKVYYTILEDRFKTMAPAEHEQLTTMLSGPTADIKAKDAELALQHGLGKDVLLR